MWPRLRGFRRSTARPEREPIVLASGRRAELRNHQKELQSFQMRLAVSAGLVLFVFFMLIIRFFYLQVIQHEYYHTLAENNRISIVPIIPNRGLILDRNGAVLAHNYSAYTLEITPAKVAELEPLINELATVVDIAPKDRKRFRKLMEEGHDFASLPIRTRLNDIEVARFAANKYRFPGVDIRARLFRHYPNGEIASHVIGYIGRLTEGDLDKLEKKKRRCELHRLGFYRQGGSGGSLRNRLAWHHGIRGSRDRRKRPLGAHAAQHLARVGKQSAALAGCSLTRGCRARVRRSSRRADCGRARYRRCACAGEQAWLRSQPLRGRHRPEQLGSAQHFARSSAQ
jgi:penicillin-binding protein 2